MRDETARRSPRLRVAVVTETYPPEMNGVAHTLQRVVHSLRARGHEVSVTRPRQGADRAPPRQDTLTQGLPLPGYPGLQFGLPAWPQLRRQWQASRPDVAYIATEGPLGYSALGVAGRLGIPTLTGLHTRFDHYSRHYGAALLGPAIQRYLQRFHNRSAGTLVPTRALAARLAARGFRNLRVWGRGVDTVLFDPARRSRPLRESWGVGGAGLAILYVGRVAPEKNIGLAVDAYQAIRERDPSARLIVVGEGPALETLRRSCPGAVLTGPQRGEALATHFASGDLFLFPSLTETFGNVVIEAMASGLAVVAFDDAAAGELIESGRNGWLARRSHDVDFLRCAVLAASLSEQRAACAAAARATAEQHRWPLLIDRFEELLLETVGGASTASLGAAQLAD